MVPQAPSRVDSTSAVKGGEDTRGAGRQEVPGPRGLLPGGAATLPRNTWKQSRLDGNDGLDGPDGNEEEVGSGGGRSAAETLEEADEARGQVKRHERKVDVDGLRWFMAVLGDEDVGLIVNTGGFTRDAQDEARTQEKRRISLLDLERLFDLWVEHYEKLGDAAQRRMPLKPISFLAPAE